MANQPLIFVPIIIFTGWLIDSIHENMQYIHSQNVSTEPFEVVLGKGADGVSFAGVREAVNEKVMHGRISLPSIGRIRYGVRQRELPLWGREARLLGEKAAAKPPHSEKKPPKLHLMRLRTQVICARDAYRPLLSAIFSTTRVAKVNHFVTFAVNYTDPNCFANLAENFVGSLLF